MNQPIRIISPRLIMRAAERSYYAFRAAISLGFVVVANDNELPDLIA